MVDMVTVDRVIFKVLVLILIKTTANGARLPDQTFGLLSEILGNRGNNPLIVVVDKPSHHHHLLRSSDNQNVAENDIIFGHSINEDKALQYVGDILRSTGDENDPAVQEANLKFENALRSRCEKYLDCQVKCKKPEKKCENKCQKTYDNLKMCGEKKEKKKKCGESEEYPCGKKFTVSCSNNKCGKTLPPNW